MLGILILKLKLWRLLIDLCDVVFNENFFLWLVLFFKDSLKVSLSCFYYF